jgi:GH35 family endo-1,4-beta-xylanase
VYKPYAEARQNLNDYISTVAGHFSGRIYSWDVLNEAIRRASGVTVDEANWGRHAIGHIWPSTWISPWYRSYGTDAPDGVNPWDYVYDAFVFARKADPHATLYYNDYNMEDPDTARMVVNMVNVLNREWANDAANNPQAGVYGTALEYKDAGGRYLIEGIGLQEHDNLTTSLVRLETALQMYIGTGCVISITELDVGVTSSEYKDGRRLTERGDYMQAKYYAELFTLLKKYHEHIERVSFWGLSDSGTWRSSDLPLLFDDELRAKEAYWAVLDPEGWLAANVG